MFYCFLVLLRSHFYYALLLLTLCLAFAVEPFLVAEQCPPVSSFQILSFVALLVPVSLARLFLFSLSFSFPSAAALSPLLVGVIALAVDVEHSPLLFLPLFFFFPSELPRLIFSWLLFLLPGALVPLLFQGQLLFLSLTFLFPPTHTLCLLVVCLARPLSCASRGRSQLPLLFRGFFEATHLCLPESLRL